MVAGWGKGKEGYFRAIPSLKEGRAERLLERPKHPQLILRQVMSFIAEFPEDLLVLY